MALDASGTLALSEIQTEYGGSNPIGMSEYYGDGDYVPDGTADGDSNAIPESGAISISHFYDTTNAVFMVATGGSISTSGDYKIHTFTSSGTFQVTTGGNDGGNRAAQTYILAGGGAGGPAGGTGGGGGGTATNNSAGLAGGSGIVILRYPTTDGTISVGAGLTSSSATDGSDTVITFTEGTGTVSWS